MFNLINFKIYYKYIIFNKNAIIVIKFKCFNIKY